MPTSFTTSVTSGMTREMYQQLSEMQAASYERAMSNAYVGIDGGIYPNIEDAQRSQAQRLRQKKAKERAALKQFFATGVPHDSFGLSLASNGKLYVYGQNMRGNDLMFTMDKRRLVAVKGRTSHVNAILRKLAEQESLRYEVVDSLRTNRRGRGVAVWNFKHRKEVDDSELVASAQPRVPEPTLRERSVERLDPDEMFTQHYSNIVMSEDILF
jgi:hypothetical protein